MAISLGFGAALSGLNASAKSLEVTGHNIANTGTVGFKSSRAEFSDVLAKSISGGFATQKAGMGSNTHAVVQQFLQGNLRTTENPMDMAINGRGFFMLEDGEQATTYSRNGQFHLEGVPVEGTAALTPEALEAQPLTLKNATGLTVLGYPVDYATDPTGVIDRAGDPVRMVFEKSMPGNATTNVEFSANFAAASESLAAVAFDPDNADTFHYARSFNAINADGEQDRVDLYFRKLDFRQWEMHVLEGGVAQPTALNFEFDPAGKLLTGQTQALTLQSGQAVTLDLTGSTQYGGPFSLDALRQDGYLEGRLTGMVVDKAGIVVGRYSNAQTRNLGQLALADFSNPNGLLRLGDNQWAESEASGAPTIGTAHDVNGFGAVNGATLEDASVDLNQQLVDLIIQQRNYQANAQAIKTQDQILQTLSGIR